MLVTGDIGCGKTTLCRRLLAMLPPRTFISVILNPFLTAEDLLKQVLVDFGLVSNADIRGGALTNASCHDLVRTLHDFLGTLAQLDASAVIILDEAQDLTLRTIEQIRLLSNYETDSTKLLQIILVGQTNLEAILELEQLRQFGQRISRGAGSSRSSRAKSGRISPGASPLRSPIPIVRSWRAPPASP